MRGHNTIPRIVPSFSLFCSEIMVLAPTAGGIRTWHGILAGGTIALAISLAGLTIGATPLVAQVRTTDTITTTIGADYASGGLHRWLLGSGYRDIWTTPVRVPVLDLANTAGGLTPEREGGGTQTSSLRFSGADGREYVFRSIRKDPTEVLPAGLRESALSGLIEDQMSTALPVGALLVSPILDAVGVLHARPTFVVLPDDPRLGEFRREFGGVVGLFEERPRDDDDPARSFAGAERVESTEKLRDELEEDPDIRVDAEAFLEARLLDVFLGDWDRHQDQWRWALIANGGGPKRWMPIPRDRDQAFVRFDGVALAMARQIAPQLVKFGPDYPRTVGATWNGRDVDRELLVSLERPAWQESAARLQGLLTDEVLERAVALLPGRSWRGPPSSPPSRRAATRSRRWPSATTNTWQAKSTCGPPTNLSWPGSAPRRMAALWSPSPGAAPPRHPGSRAPSTPMKPTKCGSTSVAAPTAPWSRRVQPTTS
jgi:hypothetical protein